MVRTVRWLGVSAVVGMAVLLMGCPKKPAPSDAGADGAAASASAAVEAAAPAAAPVGANDAEVTKYPDQNADNQDAVTSRMIANARTEASNVGGKLVATLRPGTAATRIADHEGFDLVVFADPSDATKQLEGWVAQNAFGAVPHGNTVVTVVDGGPPKQRTTPLDIKKSANGTCPGGYASCGAMCRATCKVDADCELSTAHCSAGYCLGPGASPCAK